MDWFIKRKLFHIASGMLITLLLVYRAIGILHLSALLAIGLILSACHKHRPLPLVSCCLHHLDRKREYLPGQGALTFLLGIIILLSVLGNTEVVHASIMVLSFGDSFASLIGRQLSRASHISKTALPVNEKKHLEATVFGIIAGFLGASLFVSMLQALAGAVAGMAIEGIEIKIGKARIDDNILITITAGAAIYIIARLGGV